MGQKGDGATHHDDDWDEDAKRFADEWAKARVEAGHSADPYDYPTHGYEFAPVLLLYVGLFLGPIGPIIFTILLLKRQTPLRGLLVIASVSIAAWLALQGVTWGFQDGWSTFQLQFCRSAFNFAAGLVAYLIVRKETKKSHAITKGTLFNTAVALAVIVAVAFMVPSPWLMVLGR